MFCIDICVDVIYLYRYIHDGIDILLITTLLYIYIHICFSDKSKWPVTKCLLLSWRDETCLTHGEDAMLNLRAEKQKFYNKTGNRSVCVGQFGHRAKSTRQNFWVPLLVWIARTC